MSGYKTHRFSQEPDDYEGPWPKESVMTVDEFMDLVGGDLTESEWRTARAALEAMIAPAAPQQVEPVAQIGWADEFGNLFPMGAWKPTQRTHHDSHKTVWRPVFLHPPAAEVQRLKQERDGLKNRLEWRHDGGPDGISARDETIKMQDAEVRRLQEALEPFTAIDLTTNQAVDPMDVLRARRALEGGE